MKFRQLLILTIITAAVVYAALNFWNIRTPETVAEKNFFFPQLSDRINDVKIVKVKGYEEEIVLAYQGEQWVLQSSDNFPALAEKVKKLIIGLSEFKIDSEKTKNPELYSRLAVEGPFERKTASKLVYLLDENGDLIASLILGKFRDSNTAVPAMYVREPDVDQAFLVQGQVEVSSNEKDWFEDEIINLGSEEVKSITITHSEQTPYTLARENKGQLNFNLTEIPEGKKQQSEVVINRLGRLLENIRALGVRSIDALDFSSDYTGIAIKTFRGLVINIKAKTINDAHYANFQFEYDPSLITEQAETTEDNTDAPDPEQEVALLNEHISPWAFKIQKFKFDDMTTRLEQLVR